MGLLSVLPQYLHWDWSVYDPLNEAEVASRIRLFPSRWKVFSETPQFVGEPQLALQNLGDLADWMSVLHVFLKETVPGRSVFARYFCPESQAADLLDPEKPLIFPSEGRQLAIGVLAGILKNFIAPKYGHLVIKEQGSPDFGLGIDIVENVDLLRGWRVDLPTPTDSISRVLSVAVQLKETLREDPDVPQKLSDLLPKLDEIQQVGALYLGAKAQWADGGFTRRLNALPDEPRPLMSTVVGLQALSAGFRPEIPWNLWDSRVALL